jgi:hypothetical protein
MRGGIEGDKRDGAGSEKFIQLSSWGGVGLRVWPFFVYGVFWGFIFRGEWREAMGGGDPIASIGSHRIFDVTASVPTG